MRLRRRRRSAPGYHVAQHQLDHRNVHSHSGPICPRNRKHNGFNICTRNGGSERNRVPLRTVACRRYLELIDNWSSAVKAVANVTVQSALLCDARLRTFIYNFKSYKEERKCQELTWHTGGRLRISIWKRSTHLTVLRS